MTAGTTPPWCLPSFLRKQMLCTECERLNSERERLILLYVLGDHPNSANGDHLKTGQRSN
jgi:hypothetical protein